MDLLYKLVCTIADHKGVDPKDLDPRLRETVNIEALEALISGPDGQQESPSPLVEFPYDGYTIKIGEKRNISISESTTADSVLRSEPDRSRESISTRLDHHKSAMKDVSNIISARKRPFEKQLDGLLEVVRKVLCVESATLSYVDNGTYVFEAVDVADTVQIHAGESVPLENTVCKGVVETEQTLCISNVDTDVPELANSSSGVSAYLGVPVFVNGEVYGTLCFYDRASRDEEFSEWDLAFVELLRNWVGSELEQRQQERTIHASTTERPYTGATSN